jgi:hypothetical protein
LCCLKEGGESLLLYVERRRVLGNVLDPHMEGANRLLSTLNPPNTCGTDVALAISIN